MHGLDVAVEVARRAECLAAARHETYLDIVGEVELHVLLELVVAWEGADTTLDWAWQWLDVAMESLVSREVAGRAEALGAGLDGADVWSFACVGLHA